MSRKTKKEKILAEYRRKLQALKPPTPQTKPRLGAPTPIAFPKEYQLPKAGPDYKNGPKPSHDKAPISDFTYVFHDLRRIGIITLLAFCAQLVLWLTVGKQL